MPTAFSYLRFSTPEQAAGDSVRRQTQARDAWLAAHPDVTLDTSLQLTDAGRSAFQRKDWATYALAQFVERIKAGRVPRGSYLLVENLDRLSREHAGDALELFLSIVNKGVVIVQLSPAVLEFRRPVDAMQLMFAVVELSRGHSESAVKSERGRAAWGRKVREAGSRVVTRKLPTWVVEEGGALALDPAKAALVRRIFDLCVGGAGCYTIASTLNAEGVPVMGRTVVKGRPVRWADATVRAVLTSRAAVGEFVPYNRRNKSASRQGEPVKGYFPAVVDEATWQAAQAAMRRRAVVGRGRRGKRVNLFAGLMTDVLSGSTITYAHSRGRPVSLVPLDARAGRGAAWESFPAEVFEAALLSQLRELTAADVAGGDDPADKVAALEGRLAEVATLRARWAAKMDNPNLVDAVAAKLDGLAEEAKRLEAELAVLRPEAASPASEALAELRTLADVLDADGSDATRLKVRALLRRVVSRVRVGLSHRGRLRCAVARVDLSTGRSREYVVLHRDGLPTYVASAAAGAGQTAPVNWKQLEADYRRRVLDARPATEEQTEEQTEE